jgi:hypothetical protein
MSFKQDWMPSLKAVFIFVFNLGKWRHLFVSFEDWWHQIISIFLGIEVVILIIPLLFGGQKQNPWCLEIEFSSTPGFFLNLSF